MSHLKKFAKITALTAVPLLVAGLAGCVPTAESEPTGAAKSSDGAGTSVQGGSGPQAPAGYEEWYLKYAKCMRDKGVDVPDTPQSSVSITADDGYLEASESCEKNVGPAPGQSPGDEKATNEAMRAIAKCFREAGFDVADPKLGEAGQFPADAPQNVVDQCIAAGGQ